MPRRIIVAILLTVVGFISVFDSLSLNGISWLSLFLSVAYILSGFLIYKGIPAGHYVAAPVLAISIYFKINALIAISTHEELTISHDLALKIFGPASALILFYCLGFFLIVRDIIKQKTSPRYEFIVKTLNEPELWLYPWLITLLCLYILRYDYEVSYFMYLLSPIALLFIHKLLKNSSLVAYESIKKVYIISSVCWFSTYVLIIGFSGYILALIAAGLASQGAGQ